MLEYARPNYLGIATWVPVAFGLCDGVGVSLVRSAGPAFWARAWFIRPASWLSVLAPGGLFIAILFFFSFLSLPPVVTLLVVVLLRLIFFHEWDFLFLLVGGLRGADGGIDPDSVPSLAVSMTRFFRDAVLVGSAMGERSGSRFAGWLGAVPLEPPPSPYKMKMEAHIIAQRQSMKASILTAGILLGFGLFLREQGRRATDIPPPPAAKPAAAGALHTTASDCNIRTSNPELAPSRKPAKR